jgi:predicted house-cleaning noncanonical NTP pyrophosphatase (MazG superfamily)
MKSREKEPKPIISSSPDAFERAFCKRLNQTTYEWLEAKIAAGSRIEDIKYLFEISAAEIARQNNCVPQPFDRYYSQYLKSKGVKPVAQKSVKVYNKLVRDKIPKIIEASGKTCTVDTLTDEKYIAMLDAKLNEELAEYQESKSLEELADLLEVMGAVVKARGYTWDELTKVRKKKYEERGGFEKRILLKEVYEDVSSQTEREVSSQMKKQPANAGKPWTETEEEKLLDEFDSKIPIAEIAKEHGRSEGGIEARLVKLGRISKPDTASK